MTNTQVSLKLSVDTTSNKVLCAEAGKEFAEFLFHIMLLPIGTVVKLLASTEMVGSLGVLYKSIESLSNDYFQTKFSKMSVLKSTAPVDVPLLSLSNTIAPNNRYICPDLCGVYNIFSKNKTPCVADDPLSVCPNCEKTMLRKANYVAPKRSNYVAVSSSKAYGFVTGVVTYMVMDNLDVKPMSTISGIALLNKFQVKHLSSLVEKEVQVTIKEGLAILKASMETQDVLTTVFLRSTKIEPVY